MKNSTPQATLFVSTYNLPRHLQLVCEGILKQSHDDFETIICDDGSDEKTRKIISSFKERASFPVLHLWQKNEGFRKCKILNEGLRAAKGEIFIFLDGDCIPHKHYIKDHVQNQEDGFYLAGRRMELGEKFSRTLESKMIQNGCFDYPHFSLIRSVLQKDSEHLQRSIRISSKIIRKLLGMNRIIDMKGCNYSVQKKYLLEINGFDEEYEGYGREDTDVELRLQNLGLKIKSMKGLALQFHVWHPRREFTPQNDARLEELKITGRTLCVHGVKKATLNTEVKI